MLLAEYPGFILAEIDNMEKYSFLLPAIIVGKKCNILRLCLMRETYTCRDEAVILINSIKYEINNCQ